MLVTESGGDHVLEITTGKGSSHGARQLLYVPSENVLYNPRKRVVYEVRDSIAVLLPDETKPATDAEHDAWTSDPSVIKTGK